VAIPGASLDAVVESLRTILNANRALEQFHRERASNHSSAPKVPKEPGPELL
jgi:hypothetical protein